MPDRTGEPSTRPGPGGAGARGPLPIEARGGPDAGSRSLYVNSGVPAADAGGAADGSEASGYPRTCACGARTWSAAMERKHEARSHKVDRISIREVPRRLRATDCDLCGVSLELGTEISEVAVRGVPGVSHGREVSLHLGCRRVLERLAGGLRIPCASCGLAPVRIGVWHSAPSYRRILQLRCGSCRRHLYPPTRTPRRRPAVWCDGCSHLVAPLVPVDIPVVGTVDLCRDCRRRTAGLAVATIEELRVAIAAARGVAAHVDRSTSDVLGHGVEELRIPQI